MRAIVKQQKTLRFNFIMNIILNASTILFPLITTPYLSRVLLVENNGHVAFAISVVNYFILFASLGIPTYGIRVCAQVRDDKEALSKTAQELLLINTGMTLVCTLVYVASIFLVPTFRQETALMLITGGLLLLNAFGMNWLFSALEMYQYITVRSLLFRLIALVLMFILVQKPSDYLAYAVIYVIYTGGPNLLNLVYSRKLISYQRFSSYDFKRHFKPILTFFAAAAAISVYTNLDVLMLGFIKDATEVAYYNVALKVRQAIATMATSLNAILLPRLSYYAEHQNQSGMIDLWKKAIHFTFMVAFPTTLLFILCADPVIMLLAGPQYQGAVLPLQILMGTVVFASLSGITGTQMMLPLGKEKKMFYSILAGASLNFVMNSILIPLHGSIGAAIATLCAEFFVLLVQCLYQKDLLPRVVEYLELGKEALAAVAASMVVLFLQRFLTLNLIALLVISGVIFYLAYGFFILILKDTLAFEFLKTAKGIFLKFSNRFKQNKIDG